MSSFVYHYQCLLEKDQSSWCGLNLLKGWSWIWLCLLFEQESNPILSTGGHVVHVGPGLGLELLVLQGHSKSQGL